jgi:predicted acetyltransferase
VLPVAAVTRVGVRADRTRRGLLTALMRAQLNDAAERGDVLAMLWASQAVIYDRFGYGVATRGRNLRVRASRDALRPQAPAGGTVRLLERVEITSVLADVHDTLALRRPGGLTRPPGWWSVSTTRHGGGPLLAAVHTGPGGDDGFALAVPSGDEFAAALRLTDLHAADTAAAAGLWRFLLGVDLVTHIEAEARPLDEPLELLLADPRDLAVTGVEDETWLRLVDVPAALSARAFPTPHEESGDTDPAPVLLAVHDALLPDNTGVYRLGDGTAERVAPLGAVAAELECDVAALAMAYLGDRSPSALAATGWWTVHDPAVLPRADALFATDVVPWCGTHF